MTASPLSGICRTFSTLLDPQCPLDVDSGRPECANTGHSSRTCRTGQFDPKATFRFESMNGWKTRRSGRCVAQRCRREQRLLHLHHVVRLPALIVELDASAIEAKGDEEVAAVGGLDPV